MLRWWLYKGITVADIAVRRPDGTMIRHYAAPLTELPLIWARAENVHREALIGASPVLSPVLPYATCRGPIEAMVHDLLIVFPDGNLRSCR